MASASAGDPVAPEGAAATDQKRDRAGLLAQVLRRPLVVLIALAVVGVIALVYLLMSINSILDSNAQHDDRRAAQAAAEKFVRAMDSFDPAHADDVSKMVLPLVTTKAKADVQETTDQMKQLYQELLAASPTAANASGQPSGTIRHAAIADISPDVATVLVGHDVTIPSASHQLAYRWEIKLDKVRGVWLVDSFTPIH